MPLSQLKLHNRYTRSEALASLAVEYDSRKTRHFNVGLSPLLPDGGYFIFITMDKSELDPSYDYEDKLFSHEFHWVTRRDRSETHPDYVRLRRDNTRVSLFVRKEPKDQFAYLGELSYRTHDSFQSNGHPQQRYVFDLKVPVPEGLLSELTFGVSRKNVRRESGVSSEQNVRKPANLDELKKAFSYVVDDTDRTVSPEHHNYQVRLKHFFESKGVHAEFEKDFIDVSFNVGDKKLIGEIKVSGWLTLKQAFRIALGQLLEYGFLKFQHEVGMIMFLDAEPDKQRLELARRLSVAVIAERNGKYRLLNHVYTHELSAIFGF